MKKFFLTGLSLALICIPLLLLGVSVARAADYQTYDQGWTIIPEECLGQQTDAAAPGVKTCDLNSFIQLFINLAYLALKVLPYLAMIMIIAGGFVLLTSGGSSERVQSGKRMITSVIIGIVISVALAWGLSAMTVYLLTGDSKGILFSDYGAPWQKEWWGGQDNSGPTTTTGCCFVSQTASIGCLAEATEIDCTARNGYYAGNGTSCTTYVNPTVGGCTKYKSTGCCTKTENTTTTCQPAQNISGCTAYTGYTYTDTACTSIVGQGCQPQ